MWCVHRSTEFWGNSWSQYAVYRHTNGNSSWGIRGGEAVRPKARPLPSPHPCKRWAGWPSFLQHPNILFVVGCVFCKCMITHVMTAWYATWLVHYQPRDQCMKSHVISAWSTTWLVHDQPHDQCMHGHVISVWLASWSDHDQPCYQCKIRHVKSAWSVMLPVYDSQVISAWSATWSVHDQPCDQCMHSQVISVWSAWWWVHD